MTIKSSGPLSMTEIQTEFGGTDSNGIALSEYYAGGIYVPAGTIGYPNGVATAIPNTGAISISNFYGASKSIFLEYSLSVPSSNGYLDRDVFGSRIPVDNAWYPLNYNLGTFGPVPATGNITVTAPDLYLSCAYSYFYDAYSSWERWFQYADPFVTVEEQVSGSSTWTRIGLISGSRWTANNPLRSTSYLSADLSNTSQRVNATVQAGSRIRITYTLYFRGDNYRGYAANSYVPALWFYGYTPYPGRLTYQNI